VPGQSVVVSPEFAAPFGFDFWSSLAASRCLDRLPESDLEGSTGFCRKFGGLLLTFTVCDIEAMAH